MSEVRSERPVSDKEVALGLVRACHRFTRLAIHRSDPAYPLGQMRLLTLLDDVGPTSVSRLADFDRASQPATTQLVNRLVDQGWASRAPDPRDARVVTVSISAEGRDALTRSRGFTADEIVTDLSWLDDAARADLVRLAELLGEVVDRSDSR